jgi:hypothetical protein
VTVRRPWFHDSVTAYTIINSHCIVNINQSILNIPYPGVPQLPTSQVTPAQFLARSTENVAHFLDKSDRFLSIGERGNAIVMYVCVCVTLRTRGAVTESLVALLSFLARLKGQFFYIEDIQHFSECHVTSTYLFRAEVTPTTKISLFRHILSICDETVGDIEIYLMDSHWQSGYELSTDTKISRRTGPLPPFGESKTCKITKNCIPHFQVIKVCYDIFPINNFQKFFVHTSGRQMWQNFEIYAYFHIWLLFCCTRRLTQILWPVWTSNCKY